MKYLLGVLVAAVLIATGFVKGEKLTLSVRALNSVINFLNECKIRISYGDETVYRIIKAYSNSEKTTEKYLKKCCDNIDKMDFPIAWEKSVTETENYLNKEDKALLISFGKRIGTSDRQTQLDMIGFTLSEFERSLDEIKTKEKNEKKLYRVAGISLGVLAFMVII